MGVDTKKKAPPLPAPTETETTTPTEVTTDISKPGDEKSSYSLPEDGTPVTIRTRGHKANRSQTSLLIEYFEGGKPGSGSDRKPSVRVRLTPSKKSKGDHIQVTETKGTRKASLTRRIPLDEAIASREIQLGGEGGEDAHSMTSYASATEESNVSRNPIDIEIDRNRRRRRPASPLIPTGETYQPGNPSEISAIPTDSFLDGSGPTGELKRSASPSRVGDGIAAAAAGALAGVAMGEISSNKPRGKERVKISDSSAKEKSSDRKRRSKSRTSSVSEPVADEIRSSRRRSSRGHQESTVSAADSSVLSSNLSPSHRSFDTRSMRSGASKSSINNPKLLETVEDAIRRLILPELSALKREQSKREARRGSLTSTGTSASRDDVSTDRRRSSGGHRSEHSRDPSRHKERRNREARHDLDETSLRSASHDSIDAEYRAHDGDATTPKRSNNLLKVAAAGAAGAAAAKALSSAMDDKTDSPDRTQRDRRRRRAESARSRSLGRDRYSEEYDDEDDEMAPAPPMPLMSDINPSELTRTSILSADTDRPHSASEELVSGHDAARGLDSPGSTPTRARTPADLQHTLGTKHANVSHGDLNALPRGQKGYVQEYETDEFGRKVPIGDYDDYERSRNMPEVDDYPEDDFEDRYYSQQDVPPPLKYVPYQAGARGLSPIPSVSGYTEGGSEAPRPLSSRDVHSPNALPSPGKSPEHGRYVRSAHSQDSVPSNMRSREFDRASGHSENERTAAGQAVRGLGANPDFVHPPSGVESAVASLVDGSMLEQSVMTTGSGYDYSGQRDSTISDDLHSKVDRSSRGISPDKMSTDSYHGAGESMRAATPGSRSQAQSQDYSEYDIDEHGRKVPRTRYRHSPTASEAAITAGAVGAAAAALKAAQGRRQATVEDSADEAFQPAGVSRNKSFKERTTQHGWEPRNTPTHSVDRLDFEDQPKMAASGIPDMNSPMPEIGYMDDDLQTNPSVVEERLDGHRDEHDWSGRATPTQRDIGGYDPDGHDKGGGLGITEVAGAAALGAAAGMAAMHHDEPEELDEWQRTSEERKRDTLVTNPYEDASPIANPALDETILSGRGLDAQFHTGSPGFGPKYDEGYMSNGPVRTPDVEPKGKAIDFGTGANLGDDPFYSPQGHSRHLSGMSQGMASPFYDAATGAGIERIENKDIVALMQHLMVRDAQRSARDTEIVALLMNAALEMRNSFREMKELVQDTGDDVIFANVENTEKLQKAINGPRPYPGAASRSIQSGSQAGTIDDVAAKKKNLWRRALQGLGAKGTSDLSRIEDMLMQLLGEVDVLKMQTAQPVSTGGPGQSYENLQPEAQYEQDKGYEPEGISTASHASQSGHLAASQPKTLAPPFAGERRAVSDHRISTVEENDEEYQYDHPSPSAERMKANLLSPGRPDQVQRGGSVPPETPPQLVDRGDQHPQSAENTPRTDRGKKHKSSSSSGWLPKISRWSETTTSSVGRMLRGSGGKKGGPKYDDFQPPSRSGSSLASYEDNYRHDPYDDKLHTGFSDQNLVPEPHGRDEGPPPTSYQTPEDPKYKAHRNSVNLQHPQPRPGQTERYRTALETSAQEYSNNPTTPRSADWAGSATSLNRLHGNTTRHSNTSSAAAAATAAQEAEYWHSSPGPPRPPKEPIGSPLSPTSPRSADMARLKESSPPAQQSSESGYGTLTATHLSHYSGSSPKLENRNLSAALGVPTRRPTGPRAMTPRHPDEDAAREERRRKRDTFGTVASEDTDTF